MHPAHTFVQQIYIAFICCKVQEITGIFPFFPFVLPLSIQKDDYSSLIFQVETGLTSQPISTLLVAKPEALKSYLKGSAIVGPFTGVTPARSSQESPAKGGKEGFQSISYPSIMLTHRFSGRSFTFKLLHSLCCPSALQPVSLPSRGVGV